MLLRRKYSDSKSSSFLLGTWRFSRVRLAPRLGSTPVEVSGVREEEGVFGTTVVDSFTV